MEQNVAAILRPTSPDFPIPVTTTRPLVVASNSTARSKLESSRVMSAAIASASVRSTFRAVPRRLFCVWRVRAATDFLFTGILEPRADHAVELY